MPRVHGTSAGTVTRKLTPSGVARSVASRGFLNDGAEPQASTYTTGCGIGQPRRTRSDTGVRGAMPQGIDAA